MAAFFSSYNGKPVLIKTSGAAYAGEHSLTFDVNVHLFSMMARQSLSDMHPHLRKMRFQIGFVIQGASEDELPEQLLGCAQVGHLDFAAAPPFTPSKPPKPPLQR
jgi:hypothetical protein